MLYLTALSSPYPYNEILLYKTLGNLSRNWNWSHRGWTLFHTSAEIDEPVVNAYSAIKPGPGPAVVGAGYLQTVRELKVSELINQIQQLNRLDSQQARAVFRRDYRFAQPKTNGLFFSRLYAFQTPVSFTPLNDFSGDRFIVPFDLVESELLKCGLNLKQFAVEIG